MGDKNQDPWQPGGSAWMTIAAVGALIAAVSTLSNLFDPQVASAGPLEDATFAAAHSSMYGMTGSTFP